VRTVKPPNEAFAEDPARMLRAVRATARHNFRAARDISAAMKAYAHMVRHLPSARAAGELLTIMSGGYSARAVRMMWECGLLVGTSLPGGVSLATWTTTGYHQVHSVSDHTLYEGCHSRGVSDCSHGSYRLSPTEPCFDHC
jgi:hypothetical protein